MILLFLFSIHAKILVIDDIGISKNTVPESYKRQIMKNIQNKISNGNEEVVLYNDMTNTRISSRDYNNTQENTIEIDKPVMEQVKLLKQIEKYEKSVSDLKSIVQDKLPVQDPLANMDNSYEKIKNNGRLKKSNPTRENEKAYDNEGDYGSNNSFLDSLNGDVNKLRTDILPFNTNDRLQYSKMKEKDNLAKAVENRKEYIKIKLQETSDIKNKLKTQMRKYRDKIEDLLKKIKNVEKNKNDIEGMINTNKNHIHNINVNTDKIIDKKDHVLSYIRVTRNEVQRYTNLLENETNKLNMLEKQYEVYEATLRKYNDNIEQETENIYKHSNELNKNRLNLNNLEDLYQEYYKKTKQIDEEIKRYEKIEGCLDAEGNKMQIHSVYL